MTEQPTGGRSRRGHDEEDHGHHGDGHSHSHPGGLRAFLHGIFVPHSHDVADSIDDAMEASNQGVKAVKISLAGLGVTAIFQLVVVAISGSVALLADTIHNFSDALTAVPLWIAFVVARRAPTRRYTYGYGRVEDLAGLFIVAMIALSAIVAAYESIRRLADPQPLDNLGWVVAAGVIGFAGNELVAVYRIRNGRKIGSAALVADGLHARADGFTSLAVVLGAVGVWAGVPLADPIVGLVISAAIGALLWGTARDLGRRILDGVDPDLVHTATQILLTTHRVDRVDSVQMRWSGHRLQIAAAVTPIDDLTVAEFGAIAHDADHRLRQGLPSLGPIDLRPCTLDDNSPFRDR